MRILVTGGAGFIGSHLVYRLIKKKNEVIILDNLSTGRKENINQKATFIRGDVRDEDDIRKAMHGCDFVFHLAAKTDAREEGDEIFRTNFIGSEYVFSAAKDINAKIIFTSSAAVYGDAKLPIKESEECKPISSYGKSKMKAEKMLRDAFIARLFNVYGPKGSSVINKFTRRIKEGEDITVFGSGLQTRDFVYVSDVVDALMFGIEKSGTYNVGTGIETSILQLIDTIQDLAKSKPRIKFDMPIESEIKRSKADITKIRNLGWNPKTSLNSGIMLTMNSLQLS